MNSEWKPIESAPKDGTTVLICDRWGRMFAASWGYDDLYDLEPKKWIYGESHGEYNDYQSVDDPRFLDAPP